MTHLSRTSKTSGPRTAIRATTFRRPPSPSRLSRREMRWRYANELSGRPRSKRAAARRRGRCSTWSAWRYASSEDVQPRRRGHWHALEQRDRPLGAAAMSMLRPSWIRSTQRVFQLVVVVRPANRCSLVHRPIACTEISHNCPARGAIAKAAHHA